MENRFDNNIKNKRIDKKDIFSMSRMDTRFGKFDEKDKIDYYKSFRWSYLILVVLSFVFFLIEDNYAFMFIASACATTKCIYDAIIKNKLANIVAVISFSLLTLLFLFYYLSDKGVF